MKSLETRREFLEIGFFGLAGMLAGCIGIKPEGRFRVNKGDKLFDEYKEYWVEKSADNDLTTAAGILSGKIKIFRQGNVYSAEGYYQKDDDLEAYEKALHFADRHGDKIVTRKEAHEFLLKIIHEH
ncbi:hypothetical protein HYT25_04680 [Candidatus Pacearchaeota archaeon]|nr:hypothetical protein [Candidatus Pacearchaeota archaeon]